jgi:hypothetical protein
LGTLCSRISPEPIRLGSFAPPFLCAPPPTPSKPYLLGLSEVLGVIIQCSFALYELAPRRPSESEMLHVLLSFYRMSLVTFHPIIMWWDPWAYTYRSYPSRVLCHSMESKMLSSWHSSKKQQVSGWFCMYHTVSESPWKTRTKTRDGSHKLMRSSWSKVLYSIHIQYDPLMA